MKLQISVLRIGYSKIITRCLFRYRTESKQRQMCMIQVAKVFSVKLKPLYIRCATIALAHCKFRGQLLNCKSQHNTPTPASLASHIAYIRNNYSAYLCFYILFYYFYVSNFYLLLILE